MKKLLPILVLAIAAAAQAASPVPYGQIGIAAGPSGLPAFLHVDSLGAVLPAGEATIMGPIPRTTAGVALDPNGNLVFLQVDSNGGLYIHGGSGTGSVTNVSGGSFSGLTVTFQNGSTTPSISALTLTTQGAWDGTTNFADTAFVQAAIQLTMSTMPLSNVTGGVYSFATKGAGAVIAYTSDGNAVTGITLIYNGGSGYKNGDLITLAAGNNDTILRVTNVRLGVISALAVVYGGTGYATGGTNAPTSALDSRPYTFVIKGTLGSDATFIVTNGTLLTQSNQWIVDNETTGPHAVKFYMSNGSDFTTGSGVSIPQGTNHSLDTQIETDGSTDVWIVGPNNAASTSNLRPLSVATPLFSAVSGANAKAGTFELASGVATVLNSSITTNSVIHASIQAGGASGTVGPICFPTVTASTGFTVLGNLGDNSTYNYWIEEND